MSHKHSGSNDIKVDDVQYAKSFLLTSGLFYYIYKDTNRQTL